MEERLAQSEKRVATEAQKQFDLELAELRERIEAIQKVIPTVCTVRRPLRVTAGGSRAEPTLIRGCQCFQGA